MNVNKYLKQQKVLEKIRRLEERDARLDEIRRSRYSGQQNAAFGSTPSRAQSHYSLRPATSPRRATSAFSLSSNGKYFQNEFLCKERADTMRYLKAGLREIANTMYMYIVYIFSECSVVL